MTNNNKRSRERRLEVCIDSMESALNALHGGADEIEVCSSLAEGGLTPTAGLVKLIIQAVNNIKIGSSISQKCPSECCCLKLLQKPKVNVMLRCRTGSDFSYAEEEMETMLADLEVFKDLGVDRFVFGALTRTREIDVDRCRRILEKAAPLPVTFHRAFDVCTNALDSLKTIIDLGFDRLLTSGQKHTAADEEALELLKSLTQKSSGSIEIMPGAGVNASNVKYFKNIPCNIVHSSCKTARALPKVGVSMGTSECEFLYVTDEDSVRILKEAFSS